ncbi:MAG TPA: hypothetical protein VF796_16185, partial [Humisphaera sp.]
MDFAKAQVDRLKQQLAGLTPSQKMLSAALVVIMVMTLWWWGRYAGAPEMEPLMEQALSKEDLGRIDAQLTGAHIEHKVTNDGKILIQPDQRAQALAGLLYAGAMPRDMSKGWDEVVAKLTPWDGQDRQSAMFNRAKEVSLEKVIGLFPGVASASVFIDGSTKRIIGGPGNVEPTANVTLVTRDGSANAKQLASAAAATVAGAQAGLSATKVAVIVDGKLTKVRDPNAGGAMELGGDTLLEIQQAAEARLTQKVSDFLGIDGLRVAVAVRVQNASVKTSNEAFSQKDSASIELRSKTKTTENASGANTGMEGGTVPNSGDSLQVPAPSAPGRTQSEQQEETDFLAGLGKTRTDTVKPAGEPTPVGASLRIPRSYFVNACKNGNPSAKEPEQAAVQQKVAEETELLRQQVIACTDIRDPKSITVEPYVDVVPLASQAPPAAASVAGMLGGHVKELALGGLALASLFMMSMIVKKGAPVAAAAAAGTSSASSAAAAAAAAAA